LLGCFAISPMAQAVGPDTDGSIAGANNGEGIGVLVNRTSGVWNTGTGFEALNHLTIGSQNTATGLRALFNTTDGFYNTATGVYALYSNTTGWYNNAVGAFALFHNTDGHFNTANGYAALYRNTASNNTATGWSALRNNTTGDLNTATGRSALVNNTTGLNNTALGFLAGAHVTTANNVICIGATVAGANVSNSCFIGNIRGVTTANANAVPVLIDSAGQLGTMSSSLRFKNEIKPMDGASEALLALKPVTFRYKSDTTGTSQFGLIAEEVAEVNPDLVVRDENGEIYSVRYDAVNAMLLNEFLKDHRKVEEQEKAIVRLKQDFGTKIAQQAKQIEALVATVKEQASQIQKVSAQLDLIKPSPQTVLNDQ
jgi:uncharacterized coiled-coil protein SlyX